MGEVKSLRMKIVRPWSLVESGSIYHVTKEQGIHLYPYIDMDTFPIIYNHLTNRAGSTKRPYIVEQGLRKRSTPGQCISIYICLAYLFVPNIYMMVTFPYSRRKNLIYSDLTSPNNGHKFSKRSTRYFPRSVYTG